MEQHEVIRQANVDMEAATEHLTKEMQALRAGRANGALIENVAVEVYGSQMRIKDLATITTPEVRQLLLMPFDVSNAGPIAKGIEKANLGLRASLEGKSVRVFFPEMDEARRRNLVDQVHKKKEECKITIRNVRRDANEKIKHLKSEGHIPEDDVKRYEKQVQDLTDNHCKRADEIAKKKEEEVMTV